MGTRSIPQIDKEITAVRKQLRLLETIDVLSADSWQAAWNKHPDLHAREVALFRERGEAQHQRAIAENERALASLRSDRAKRAAMTRRRKAVAA